MPLTDPYDLFDARDRATERAAAADDALPPPPTARMLKRLNADQRRQYEAALRLFARRISAVTPPAIDANTAPEQPRDHADVSCTCAA